MFFISCTTIQYLFQKGVYLLCICCKWGLRATCHIPHRTQNLKRRKTNHGLPVIVFGLPVFTMYQAISILQDDREKEQVPCWGFKF